MDVLALRFDWDICVSNEHGDEGGEGHDRSDPVGEEGKMLSLLEPIGSNTEW